MRKNYLLAVLTILSLQFLFIATCSAQKTLGSNNETTISAQDLQRLASVIADVKKYYYKPVDDKKLFDNAISGMLSGLDPHSAFLNAQDLKDLEMETTGKFSGIGIEVIPFQGVLKVISPLDDTPAFRAGVKAGDFIIKINNQLVRNMTVNEALNLMRGPSGVKVELTVLRKNETKPRIFNMRRQVINIKTVKSRLLESGYGYVRVAFFQELTEKELAKAINKLQRDSEGNLKGLVLDLRNNPGGLLDTAVEIAGDFLDAKKLKENDIIVYTKGQDNEIQVTAHATPGELLPNTPLVILINEGSASAAEIVAGALQDHKRAILVGERSFGKGSVQTLIPIDRESAIKLTTALYYTPLGRSIQAKGIEPDINVENIQLSEKQDGEALPRIDESMLVDHIQNGDNADENSSSKDLTEHEQKQSKTEIDLAYKDYQLYEALHILKSMSVLHKGN